MSKSEFSDSESEGKVSSEEETENETAIENGGSRNQEKLSDYEMQRLKRIEENKRRMEVLGLHKMANSFMGSVEKTRKKNNDKKGKRKMADEDDDYNPTQDDEEMSSSEEGDENDEEFSPSKKKKKKVKKNTSTPKKRGPVQKPTFDSDFVEDGVALMHAIALSLQDSVGSLDVRGSSPQTSGAHLTNTTPSKSPAVNTLDTTTNKRKEYSPIQNDSGKRKRKKSITSRVQMTEDEMLIHFFQFDESGKGGFTLRDIRRLAAAHDFTWSDKEMADMICCFDSDGDGKISFDDFRKIVGRCNMLKGSDDGVTG